jgi:ABC-type glycerol-3-phosphate transport system permease component
MNGLPDTTPTNRAVPRWLERVGPRWFVRVVAVSVGLANLVVLVHLFGGYSPDPSRTVWEDITRKSMWEGVTLNEALAPVLVAVLSALATSEIVLRAFGRSVFSERFDQRYAAAAFGVCLGGALMGASLAAVLIFQGSLGSSYMLAPAQRIPAALYTSVLGYVIGGVLGFLEGMILAYPLAHILGRFRSGE